MECIVGSKLVAALLGETSGSARSVSQVFGGGGVSDI